MKAKTMFKNLQYEYSYVDGVVTNESPYIECMREYGNNWKLITFDLNSKTVYASSGNNGFHVPASLNMDDLEAIMKQCEELGWKEE